MEIERIYVGGWFQRTTLHLSELYDFLSEASSPLELDTKKLQALNDTLDIASVEMKVGSLQYILVQTSEGIVYRIYEDGLIVLSRDHAGVERLKEDIASLTQYYEEKLSPAFSYLFSLGAPVPKELANIKTVYPYFVVLKQAKHEDMLALLESFEQEKYFEINHKNYDIFRGNKLYLINNKKESIEHIGRFVEEQIFIREFKGQMHRYLNLHRIIWERIENIKERGEVHGRDIGALRNKIEGYAKTINLIDARINQMGAYIGTRASIVKSDKELENFLSVLEYKYETLDDTLAYVKEIWAMTKNYVVSAVDLFSGLQAQATQKSVENLTVVTSMGVGATLIGLFTTDQVPDVTIFGVGYFFALAAIGYIASKSIKWFYARKKYTISYTDYDKNIT
ncbi:hypothetical protein KTR10_01125 [Candidatus Kaiserbacteria bacterium]|nr:hypothetical protein [Candidatus Kaiserbacteria bacterium]